MVLCLSSKLLDSVLTYTSSISVPLWVLLPSRMLSKLEKSSLCGTSDPCDMYQRYRYFCVCECERKKGDLPCG